MTSKQQNFLNKIGPMAQADMKETQILASLTIAQAILESNWGESGLTEESNNLFGIKGQYNGQSVMYPTQEWDGTKYVNVNAEFKKYPSWKESVSDHSALFHRLERYHNLIGVTDAVTACKLVQADGYATSPIYAQSLINLISSYDLTKYDVVGGESSSGENEPAVQPGSEYTVKFGDSWWRIADQQLGSGSKMYELAEYNGKTISAVIHPGDVIKIPTKDYSGNSGTSTAKTHIVKFGESWWSIAEDEMGSGTKMYELAAYNGKTIEAVIHPGDSIAIPN